jgi:cobalamin-dependent methionine synthase I
MKKPRETKRSSDEAVKAKTGKVWAEWFKILDKAGARKWPHKDIAAYLKEKQKVQSWWCQMVAVGYEHERGIRQKFQKCDGEFSAGGSRTMAVPMAKAFAAWTDEKLRKRWLPDGKLEITTATPGKYVRGKWGTSRLSVGFYGRGAVKTQVAVDHGKLASSRESAKMKSYWFAALNRLQGILEA